MLLVGLVTSPRPTETLRQTIRSIRESYQNTRIVVAPNFKDPTQDWNAVWELLKPDGDLLPPLHDMELQTFVHEHCDPKYREDLYGSEWQHRGLQHNSDRLLRELIDRSSGPFVAGQDDFVCRPRAFERIQIIARTLGGHALQHVGAVSFYTPYSSCGESRRALWPYPHTAFYGDVCMMWRPQCAREFLEISRANEAHDLEIQRYFDTNGGRWVLRGHSPCLVQHVGMTSARGARNDGQRQTMNFDNRDAVDGPPTGSAKPIAGM